MGHEPVRQLAARVGLTPGQVHRLQRALSASEVLQKPKRVTHLGLDDLYLNKGQHLIAIDLAEQKILALAPVGTILQGRAGEIDVDGFLKDLPDAEVVTLDMNLLQMAAARRRWPNAMFVIDKRHLLQTLDRDLLTQAANVILGRQDAAGDPIGTKQAVKSFGIKAYPYLALRSLVLRRQSNLTPADLATWALLRREGGAAQILWEAYQWREALYDLYDARLSTPVIREGLTRWRDGLRIWQRRHVGQGEHYYGAPLGRIRWATETYWQECLNYATTGVTNAATESVNAEVRRFVRRGHRYAPKTVMLLVNRALTAKVGTNKVIELAPPERWVRETGILTGAASQQKLPRLPLEIPPLPELDMFPVVDSSPFEVEEAPTSSVAAPAVPIEFPPEIDLPPLEEQPVLSVAAPAPRPSRKSKTQTAASSPRRPRLLPYQASAINLPPTVWLWLHSTVTPGKRLGERWGAVILRDAPESERAIWPLLCAGQTAGREIPEVTPVQLQLWRTTVLCHYLCTHPEVLNATERLRQPRLRGLNLTALSGIDPQLVDELGELWQSLARERFRSLRPNEKALLDIVEVWHRLTCDPSLIQQLFDYRSGRLKDRQLWDVWRQAAVQLNDPLLAMSVAPVLEKISLADLSTLLGDAAFRWATALEWCGVQGGASLPRYPLDGPQRVFYLVWLGRLVKNSEQK